MDESVFDESTATYPKVDNRFNFQIRRFRIGFKGKVQSNLKYNITTALDLVGRDALAGTDAGANNGSSPTYRIWIA